MSQIIDNIVQRERKDEKEQTHKQDNIDTALRMIDEGIFTVELISKMTTLPVEEVKELIKKHSA